MAFEAAVRDQVGAAPAGPGFLEDLFQGRVSHRGREDQLGAEEVVQQQVAGGLFGRAARKHQDAVQPEAGGCRGSLAAVVRLHRPGGHQGASAVGLGFGQQEFQLAGLIPAQRQAGQIVALDEQARPAQEG